LAGVVGIMREKDEKKKAELENSMKTETMPNAMKLFEKLLAANNGNYFVGNDVSNLIHL
jgi:hypothetical protein